MALRHDQGIVLRGYPFGEADRVIIILSPNHGKLRTVAKGVRKTKSRFGGRLEPLTHVDLVLYEGRNLDMINQVEVIESFPGIRADLDLVTAAGAMAGVVDAVAQDGAGSHRLFLLLQRGLRTLEAGGIRPGLMAAFHLKLAGVLGLAPSLEDCAGCGRDVPDPRFSMAAGGVVCPNCAPAGTLKLRRSTIDLLATLAMADLADLPTATQDMTDEAQGVARRFLEYHLERRLASSAVRGG